MNRVKEVLKRININLNFIHILLIILGSIFIMLSSFHANMWFDESYTVALAKKSFNEIWIIDSQDVHPIFYYYLIKIIFILSNNNIVLARLSSCIPLIIMSIMGFTHIRKDFGEKVGILFSLLILISPVSVKYAGELRMYTWAMLFVFVMALYGYRIIKNNNKSKNKEKNNNIKNWIIFTTFGVLSAYTHYYALLTSIIINVLMLIYFIKNKSEKNIIINKKIIINKNIVILFIQGIIQLILYLPWLGILIGQTKAVAKGFWIMMPTPMELITFLNTGLLENVGLITREMALFVATIIFMLFIYMIIKQWKRKDIIAVKVCLLIMLIIVSFILIVCALMWQVIFNPRYLLTCYGLLIFSFALLLSHEEKRFIIVFILIEIIFALLLNINLIDTNYDKSNNYPLEFVKEDYKDEDIIIVDNTLNGFSIVSTLENYKNYENMYFYNSKNWIVDENYKAFGKTIYNFEFLKDYKGKIWIISAYSFDFQHKVENEIECANIIKEQSFDTKYENNNYTITLIDKNNHN